MNGVIVFWPLTQGKVAVVDLESVEKLRAHKWYAQFSKGVWYAAAKVKGAAQYMHCFLVGSKGWDHRDCDGLNNRLGNLRRATHIQNMRNTRKQLRVSSVFKGVSWKSRNQKWQARIGAGSNGRTKYLGLFSAERAAARAYDAAAQQTFGEFARLNFPNKLTEIHE